ncbi:septum site-determining protein MinC [Agrilactobacillus fermenti]|uniref:septum site-determining protein MinC n=1 Tax=Agrilactobacillus fermenti TaxID=2586909 RepID=UPI001E311FAF|nr:septum site-determining protein MinC [Agrilactobacillus fermenti]MCD2256485.1 septation inhibitor protein [Agrilactobacillus fermenti]
MDSVVLKGRKTGYEIYLNDAANFDEIMRELNVLLQKLQTSEAKSDNQLAFALETGNRLLTKAQVKRVRELFERFTNFKIEHIQAKVIDIATAKEAERKNNIHVEMAVIRSGQELAFDSDVLFLGNLHQGGVLRSHGSIFMLGQSSGIIEAGYPDNDEAVVVGDLSSTTQVRISDTVEIINPKNHSFDNSTVALINDLHVLDFDEVSNLATLRPKLFRKMEENQ